MPACHPARPNPDPAGCRAVAGRHAVTVKIKTKLLALWILGAFGPAALAQLSVSNGSPAYRVPIAVPPGVAGMAPQVALSYVAGTGATSLARGWSIEGISQITRCPAIVATDGLRRATSFGPTDKLCLDGRRLIQTDESGNPNASTNGSGVNVSSQANDAQGLSGTTYREFRSEVDGFSRIRAYGEANGDTTGASGPAYFKVWTKSGQVIEYGASPSADANTHAVVNVHGRTAAMGWLVDRISDTLGNHIDFKYSQSDTGAWGSGTASTSPDTGHEWLISEIQYAGNKVVFNYRSRVGRDNTESYYQGAKTVNTQTLASVVTYVNASNTGTLGPASNSVPVQATVLSYDANGVNGYQRVSSVKQCAGDATSTKCLPATTFQYASSSAPSFQIQANFNLGALPMLSTDGSTGVLIADFNGDGRADILRWSTTPSQNQLWLSNGDGTFTQVSNGTGAGQFNLAQQLFTTDGCYYSMVVDVNGDGLPDIARIPAKLTTGGAACSVAQQADFFINNGSNGFVQQTVKLSNGSVVPFDRVTSKALKQPFCDSTQVARSPAGLSATKLPSLTPGSCRYGYGWTAGSAVYLMDVNGDGRLDVVTSSIPQMVPYDPGVPGKVIPSCSGTTHVYLANQHGMFDDTTPASMSTVCLYSDPGVTGGLSSSLGHLSDLDGDGLIDLINVGTPQSTGSWRSNGDGSFTATSKVDGCSDPIDFNGDGLADCLGGSVTASANVLSVATGNASYGKVQNFNLTQTGMELDSQGANAVGQNFGSIALDVDGDGRQDILRWGDSVAYNTLYLSNGDGTFTAASSNFLPLGTQLRLSDGTFDFLVGDFLGRGTNDLLRVSATAASSGGGASSAANLLLVNQGWVPPDQLASVRTGLGARSSLYYVSLASPTPSNGVSGAYGPRFVRDLNSAASLPTVPNSIDALAPMYVVATEVDDTGVGSATTKTEFSYRGMRMSTNGRGMLGFREDRQQVTAADGSAMTTDTQYLQSFPYTGMVAQTNVYNDVLNGSGHWLKQTTNVYCDAYSTTQPSTASVTAPCATTGKVVAPYLYRTVATAADLNGATLPTVSTTTSVDGSGNATQVTTTTTGVAPGLVSGDPTQTFTKTLVNAYQADDTSCSDYQTCYWVRGRLSSATSTNTVPNLLSGIAVSAGASPNATAVQGKGATPANSLAAVLSVIQTLLLSD
jgi:hypothetical protein